MKERVILGEPSALVGKRSLGQLPLSGGVVRVEVGRIAFFAMDAVETLLFFPAVSSNSLG